MDSVKDVWKFEISNLKPKKMCSFFVNVFWCNIPYGNCFNKHDIYNLIYRIIHVKKKVETYQCQKRSKYFKEKKETQNTCKKNTLFFWFLLIGDFNISDIFYKVQNFNEWQLVPVITHWTYTCLNPWALINFICTGYAALLLNTQYTRRIKVRCSEIYYIAWMR